MYAPSGMRSMIVGSNPRARRSFPSVKPTMPPPAITIFMRVTLTAWAYSRNVQLRRVITGCAIALAASAPGCKRRHPVGAVHVAWQEAPDWTVNPHFARDVLAEAKSRERPILLICRSGNRTLDAGRALEADGFSAVTNILHGFEGDLDDIVDALIAFERAEQLANA